MPDVLNYKDYRQYLLDFLSARRERHSWYSVRYFADKISMDHGNLVRILQGKRGLPERSIAGCIEVIKLTGRRAEYFRILVLYQRARNPDKAAHLLERLLSITGKAQMKLEAQQFEFYRAWFHTAIYHLIGSLSERDGGISINLDYSDLAKKLTPPVTPAQAKRSVELLLELGLLERDIDGFLVQSSRSLTTGDAWKSTIVHNFQKTTLEMALSSLQRHPREMRDFSTLTMGIATKDLAKVKEILRRARKEIVEVVQESEPVDSVYHMNVQLFPMAFLEKKKI